MKYAVLSDIHGNIEALEAVLNDMKKHNPDKVIVLGDIIGYGPNPRECLIKTAEIADVLLIGNHEKEAVVPEENEMCGDAREMLEWTLRQLEGLPQWEAIKKGIKEKGHDAMATARQDGLLFVHASPEKPIVQYVWPGHPSHYIVFNDQIDNYLAELLAQSDASHAFCGHTHAPALLTEYRNRALFDNGNDYNRESTFIGPNTIFYVPSGNAVVRDTMFQKDNVEFNKAKMIINPGSVGQPRDGNPDASYAIYDGSSVEFIRVPYDCKKTKSKILELPISPETKIYFAERLIKGE